MKEELLDFGRVKFTIKLPDQTEVLSMGKAVPLSKPEAEIYKALRNPIDYLPLRDLTRRKLVENPNAQSVVVISDNTRPVPYSGESGILYPIVEEMIEAGLKPCQILILVATGTHRAMQNEELRRILDSRIFNLGVRIINHDSRDTAELTPVGQTKLGGKIFLNRHYVESDIKILTGLVESHFMAGTSGGRKSICPGLLAEGSTHILHSGPVLDSPRATNLAHEGNPCHEETLRVAKMADCDMIVNVTLDSNYKLTGIFCGSLETAHLAAVEKLCSYVAIPISKKYDLVLTHAGFVGVNHYQAAKAAVAAAPLMEKGGICILAAYHTDLNPIGGENYKKMMRLLGERGAEKFIEMILDPEWSFVPEQWEAQMWTRLFKKIPPENLIYCSKEIPRDSFSWLPETDACALIPKARNLKELVEKSLEWAVKKLRSSSGREPRIAFLPDGPYGIPVEKT
ncbi:MAG: nickel-dependent lactate racemase [Candidatus Aminicenantaceae bacterium]